MSLVSWASICKKGCLKNTPGLDVATVTIWQPFDDYHNARGLRWPVVEGKETQWRYSEGNDPYVKAGKGTNSTVNRMAKR